MQHRFFTASVFLAALLARAQLPNPPAPLAWYLFNEPGNDVLLEDSSGNANHAEILAPEHVGRVDDPMPALWFDGEPMTDPALAGGGVVESHALADPLFEPAFSISLWIFPESLPGVAPIATKVTDVDAWTDGFGLYIEDGQLHAFVNDVEEGRMTGAQARAGAWTHLCLTFDGATANLYVNSQPRATVEPETTEVVTEAPLRLGTLIGLTETWPFHGLLADTRVYDTALTEEEIFDLFSSTPVSDLVDSLVYTPLLK